jgi:perosamine synthetase
MSRIPSAGVPITMGDILSGWLTTNTDGLRSELANYSGARHAGLASTGSASFFLILKALAARSDRTEIVLPAYTAPVVILPVLRAGLRPVIADVDLDTFNMDMADAARLAGDKTLAIMPAHMFGIPCDIAGARAAADGAGAAVVEDAASAIGSTLGGRMAGSLGDAGFYSFHRGKQITSVTGGAWVTSDDELAAAIEHEAAALQMPGFLGRLRRAADIPALALAVRPWFYTLCHPLLARFKDTAPHEDFDASACTATQAGTVSALLARIDRIIEQRNRRAERAREMLSDADGITLPTILPDTRPSFNHCPLMLPDSATRGRALRAALSAGIECTTLYDTTIHRAYDMTPDQYGGGECPRADELASRLLLIPCHPMVPMARVEQAAEIVRRAVRQEEEV